MKGFIKNRLYVLDGKTIECNETITTTKTMNNTQLWNLRLVHINNKGMEELNKTSMFHEDNISGLAFYESYILGKSQKVKFNKGIINYIHSNL